jgi:hypothetical protein
MDLDELDLALLAGLQNNAPDDEANRAAVRAVSRDQLNLVGIGVYGPRGAVDKALRGARPHD